MINKILNDKELISFLTKNYSDIQFLSIETRNLIKTRFTKSELKEIFHPSKENSLDVLDFWERLLVDAVKFLKWHDLTEFKKRRLPKKKAYRIISEAALGIYNLKDYFKAFIEFEKLLYGAERHYRDHVYHIVRVWLTGQYILKQCFKNNFCIEIFDGEKIQSYLEKESSKKSNKLKISQKTRSVLFEGEEDAIWCLIALTHDLGYPLSKVENINESLKKMMQYFVKTGLEEFSFAFPQQNQFINDAILRYMSSKIISAERNDIRKIGEKKFNTHVQAKYYLKFSRSFERFDHGLISCIVLAKNLIYFLETNFDWDPEVAALEGEEEARQFIIRREILRAIASHTCPEIYHFKPDTFQFLLLIADEIQFWGRPTFELMAFGVEKDYEIELKRFDSKEISFEIRPRKTARKNKIKKESLIKYFKAKSDLFKKILRIAVDSTQREFTLKFTIIDDYQNEYEFISAPLAPAILKLNGRKIETQELEKIIPLFELGREKYSKQNKLFKKYQKTFPLRHGKKSEDNLHHRAGIN